MSIKNNDDSRASGNASKVKVIHPNGKITYQEPTYYETLPLRSFNYRRLYEDIKTVKKKEKKP